MMTNLVILVPAAGQSARMGDIDKLVLLVEDAPLLRRQVRAALTLGAPVLVALPQGRAQARAAALAGLAGPLDTQMVDGAEGMAAALRAGAAAAAQRGAQGLMVVLPDMPDIGGKEIAALARSFAQAPQSCLRATTAEGHPGHPVILPARLFPALAALRGDTGARAILAKERVRTVALPGQRAITDLDTPEAWARWRAQRGE